MKLYFFSVLNTEMMRVVLCIALMAVDVFCTDAALSCASAEDCELDGWQCRHAVHTRCRCYGDTIRWLDSCLPRRELHEPCRVSAQCRATLSNTICSPLTGRCTCNSGSNVMSRDECIQLSRNQQLTVDQDRDEQRRLNNTGGLRARLPVVVVHSISSHDEHKMALRGIIGLSVLLLLTVGVYVLAVVVAAQQRRHNLLADETSIGKFRYYKFDSRPLPPEAYPADKGISTQPYPS